MRIRIRQIMKYLTASGEDLPLEIRLFISTVIITAFLTVISCVLGVALGLPRILLIIGYGIFLFLVIVYYFIRVKHIFKPFIKVFVFLCIAANIAVFLFGGGIDSQNVLILSLTFVLSMIIVSQESRKSILIAYLILILCLYLLQYFRPELITPYQSRSSRWIDAVSTTLYSFVFLFAIIQFLLKNYIYEKTKAETSEKSLQELNKTLENRISERTKDLLESKVKFQTLLNSAAEAIYGLDMMGKCTFANQSCLKILGFEKEEDMIGEIVHDLIHHSYPDGSPFDISECRMNLALKQEKEIHADNEFFWKADGTLIPIEFWSHPVVVNGRIEGAVVTFFDITERKQAEKDLRQAKLEAEIANRAKSDFLLNTSHEFRTPLNAVIGYAKLLETADEQNRKEYAESIIESGNRLLDMVDDILELIRTEKSEFVPEYDFVETYGFFREFERRFAWTIARKNVLFKTNLAADLPETIRVDIKRLRLVISNLLENAVKYTDKGKIELQVYQKKTDKEKRNTTEIIIEVIDTGDRITEEDQKRILDVFSQKENKTISGEISIGLSLVSRIVNMLNGTIQVITQAGMGSRFVVSFPNITYSSNEKQVPGDEVKPDPAKWVEDPGEIIDLKGLMADLEGDCLETSKTFENKQPIAEVRKFGMTLTRLGEKHNCAMISDFGQKLADAADNFDIHGILKMIGMYPELIQALKA